VTVCVSATVSMTMMLGSSDRFPVSEAAPERGLVGLALGSARLQSSAFTSRANAG
jgi:hypothetical protein